MGQTRQVSVASPAEDASMEGRTHRAAHQLSLWASFPSRTKDHKAVAGQGRGGWASALAQCPSDMDAGPLGVETTAGSGIPNLKMTKAAP